MAGSLGTYGEPSGSPAGTETEGRKGVQRLLFCGSIPLCVIFLLSGSKSTFTHVVGPGLVVPSSPGNRDSN